VGTAEQDRGHSYDVIPRYIGQIPLGAGLGSVGPATGIFASKRGFNGETQFSYLLVEVGIAGLIVILGLHLQLIGLALTRIRKMIDPELRSALAALAAPLIGIFALFLGGSPLSGSPSAPYFWFVAGIFSFWLAGGRWRAHSAEDQSLSAATRA